MTKVENLTDRGVPLLRWRILPKSDKALNPAGEIKNCLPDEVAYSNQAKRLADNGVLWIQGYSKPKPKPRPEKQPVSVMKETGAPAEVVTSAKEEKADDATSGAPKASPGGKKKKARGGDSSDTSK